jgi:hypothetical protein
MTNTQITMSFQNARYEAPRPGSTTWHKGERCTVLGTDEESYAQPMTRVAFDDGRTGLYKTSELGLKAGEVAAYLARKAA